MNNNANRIFCAFPMFAPSEKMFEKNMASIESFIEYLKANPYYLDGGKGYILDVYFGGWTIKDEYFEKMKSFIKENIPDAKVFQYDKNYGKAKIVNNLSEEYSLENPATQFMFTMDSDMLFIKEQPFVFDRLALAAKAMQDTLKRPFGMIALDQKGECCHWYDPKPGYKGMDQKISYNLNGENTNFIEDLVWPSDGAGIAGGGLFLNYIIWKSLGGYSEGNHPYHGEDGFYLRDVQKSGASVCIAKTISLHHPVPNDDPEYRAWKDSAMKETWEKFDEKKNIDSIEKSMELWNK